MTPRPLVAVLLLLVGLTACSGGPGATASPATGISAPKVFYLPPHGDTAGPHNKVPFHLKAEDPDVLNGGGPADHRLTMDLVGAEGAVRLWVKSGHGCRGSDTHVVCTVQGQYDSWVGSDRVYPTATKDGEPGDSAVIRFSFATKEGKTLTTRTRVVVGEPVPRLRVAPALDHIHPGADVATTVTVRNTGEVPVRGLGLMVHSGDNTEFRRRYSNCRYPPQQHGRAAVCRFPGLRIAPGETVTLRPSLPLRAGKTRIFSEVTQEVWPLDVGPAKYSAVPDNGDPGDGPALEAVRVPARTDGATFVNGPIRTLVGLDLHADYRVTVNELHVGKKRELRLTVHNDGPGDPGATGRLRFTPPPGAVVRAQPMEAIDDDVYEPACPLEDDGSYNCPLYVLEPGATRTYKFTLDLAEPGTGLVALRAKALEADGVDPEPGDNTANVVVLP
ncbi:hypothetical protein [Streptomyces brasiliensis]|uniref:DUF11 domain-containing protein n=1 Tax=Streptomyces brasiliensis TaxID=1954 RepID=A0A917NUU2_9ACTN|nr:hypothetical protein [Streptomyces brasiliensis]GGJ32136.1 hypothetical protein GCM10010121_049140 [Streptomyces brasiliensis]